MASNCKANLISIHALREEGDSFCLSPPIAVFDFYPRPPRGGRRAVDAVVHLLVIISIHALREEGDQGGKGLHHNAVISIHALREEGDSSQWPGRGRFRNFYPRPPRGGRLEEADGVKRSVVISIHALREEGDRGCGRRRACQSRNFYPRPPRGGRRARGSPSCRWCRFLSTPSARRATAGIRKIPSNPAYFYPRPPRGGRRPPSVVASKVCYFYPRPPRGGRPWFSSQNRRSENISIHALREEGDQAVKALLSVLKVFLSTPSARRATAAPASDNSSAQNFYPRPPRGGRHDVVHSSFLLSGISIHALREEGDVAVLVSL